MTKNMKTVVDKPRDNGQNMKAASTKPIDNDQKHLDGQPWTNPF